CSVSRLYNQHSSCIATGETGVEVETFRSSCGDMVSCALAAEQEHQRICWVGWGCRGRSTRPEHEQGADVRMDLLPIVLVAQQMSVVAVAHAPGQGAAEAAHIRDIDQAQLVVRRQHDIAHV